MVVPLTGEAIIAPPPQSPTRRNTRTVHHGVRVRYAGTTATTSTVAATASQAVAASSGARPPE
jgi:hypothetical protein